MKLIRVILAALFLLPVIGYSQTSARDSDIDAKLNATALTGIAPPTGAQALAPAAAGKSQSFTDPYLPAAIRSDKTIFGQTDGKARVYEVKGKAVLTKKGSPVEKKLSKGDILVAGDTVRTESGAWVSVTFDESYKNAVRIPQNSKAVFASIEPTDIQIEDGSVFSAVDGLPQGSTWKVTTPSAVAAVRGTLYIVNFQAANGQFFAATVNVPDDGKNSAIDIQEISGTGSANVPEGKEITLQQGQAPDQSLVQELDPSVLAEILQFFEDLIKLRQDEGNSAPPTSGDYTGTGVLDSAGSGVIGGDDNQEQFDPQDFGTTDPLPPSPEVNSGDDEYGPPVERECPWEKKYEPPVDDCTYNCE